MNETHINAVSSADSSAVTDERTHARITPRKTIRLSVTAYLCTLQSSFFGRFWAKFGVCECMCVRVCVCLRETSQNLPTDHIYIYIKQKYISSVIMASAFQPDGTISK